LAKKEFTILELCDPEIGYQITPAMALELENALEPFGGFYQARPVDIMAFSVSVFLKHYEIKKH